MISHFSTYLVFFATLLFFSVLIFIICTINSTLGQFGLFLFIPAVFLITPSILSKKLSFPLIIFNGIILDYYNMLPLGLSVFLLILCYILIQENLHLSKASGFMNSTPLLIALNCFLCVALFTVTKFDFFALSSWQLFRFLTDSLASSIVVYLCSKPIALFLDSFTLKISTIASPNSLSKE